MGGKRASFPARVLVAWTRKSLHRKQNEEDRFIHIAALPCRWGDKRGRGAYGEPRREVVMLFVHRAPRLPFVAAGDDACCPQRFLQRAFLFCIASLVISRALAL